MKKRIYTVFCLATLMLASCNSNEEILTEPTPKTTLENTDFKNDLFVNGVNQTYLEENGISEQEFFSRIEKEDISSDLELNSKLDDESKTLQNSNLAARTTFDRSQLAGAIAGLFYDIKKNPGRFFRAKIGDYNNKTAVSLGLSHELIAKAIERFPSIKNNSRKNRIRIHGLRLKGIYTSGNVINIKIRGNVKYRKYKRIFRKLRRLFSVSGSVDLTLRVVFNNNTIKVDRAILNRIKLSRGRSWILRPVRSLISSAINRFVSVRKKLNINISLDRFLPKKYVEFIGINRVNQFHKGRKYIFFTFKIKSSNGGIIRTKRIIRIIRARLFGSRIITDVNS